MIESVRIDGDAIALADVFASVTLRHGRDDVDADPIGSAATLSLVNVDAAFTQPFRVGRELAIDVLTAPGRISAAENLVSNPSFESPPFATPVEHWQVWTPSGIMPVLTWSGDPDHIYDGARAGFATCENAEGVAVAKYIWDEIGHDVEPGQELSVSVKFTGAAGAEIGIRVAAGVGIGGVLLPSNTPTAFDGDFLSSGFTGQDLGGIFTVPAGVTQIQAAVFVLVPAASIVYLAMDGWEVRGLVQPRFRGRITDAALNTDDPDEPTLSILAVSTLARISGRKVGAGAWPSESWSDRVERAFTEANAIAELRLDVGTEDPVLAARAAEETTLADVLQELAATVAAAVTDLPDGRVLVQAVTSRQGTAPVELDPNVVVLAPEWAQSDDVRNIVRVDYDGGTIEVSDATSIDVYDERAPLTIGTLLANSGDANARALLELNRRARPDWRIDSAELLELNPALRIGSAVLLTELPAASPRPIHVGMLEGWTDQIEAIGDELEWTMTLALSPQRLSGYGITWNDLPPAVTWDDAATVEATWDEPDELLTL